MNNGSSQRAGSLPSPPVGISTGFPYARDPVDEAHLRHLTPLPDPAFQKELPIELPRTELSTLNQPPSTDPIGCGGCNTNPPPPWLPVAQGWRVSWTIPASSVTNHPASFTGACTLDVTRGAVREETIQPVNYYMPLDTRTNALRQTYQTWRAVTNDLTFSAIVVTTNQAGRIGAFTK